MLAKKKLIARRLVRSDGEESMSNKLAKERNRKRQPTNKITEQVADQSDYEAFFSNITDFTNAALLVEQEIKKYRASDNKLDLSMTIDSRTPGNKWASMKTVSHFNLGIALELMLKYLLLRNGISDYPRGRDGHKLTLLYEELRRLPSVTQQLETTYQEITGGNPTAFFALKRQSPKKQPPLEARSVSTLSEIFVYFDEDAKLWEKRYSSWEPTGQQRWRHYVNDLFPFAEFIRHVMENWTRYIAPEVRSEDGGTGLLGPSQELECGSIHSGRHAGRPLRPRK